MEEPLSFLKMILEHVNIHRKKKREQNQTKCTGDRPHDFKPGS